MKPRLDRRGIFFFFFFDILFLFFDIPRNMSHDTGAATVAAASYRGAAAAVAAPGDLCLYQKKRRGVAPAT